MKKLDSIIKVIAILLAINLIVSCGDPGITVAENKFESKIVIEGFLYPHKEISIILTKNFPLNNNTSFNVFDLIIDNAAAQITDLASGLTYALTYNPQTLTYDYTGNDLQIEYGKSYLLNVSAEIEGKQLTASSVTNVPQAGFEIIESSSQLGQLQYRESDNNGEIKNFKIAFTRSEKIGFYVISILSLDASDTTFVYDNPYNNYDQSDVNFFFDDLVASFEWSQNLPLNPAQEPIISKQEIQWIGLSFYGRYRAIMYAGDQNFKDFFLTHSTVQTIDGNFYEPSFHIKGDGIGVFGSAITDTVYFEIIK